MRYIIEPMENNMVAELEANDVDGLLFILSKRLEGLGYKVTPLED